MAEKALRRGYRYRFYPTMAQAEELRRTFGCVRKVHNLALDARNTAWSAEHRLMTYSETSTLLSAWKKTPELAFLADVSSVPLQQTLRHLQAAFMGFWAKRSGYPRFKAKRRSKQVAEYSRSGFRFRNGEITLAKMKEALDIRWSRPLPTGVEPSTAYVSLDRAGRWFISLVIEDPSLQPLPPTESVVGVDLGLSTLATLSTGEKIANPRHSIREQTRLARAQRAHARKMPGSANKEKARLRVARITARVRDRRHDYLHKLSTRLVREKQAVVIEDLPVANLKRNRRLARAISDAGWGTLRSMLEVKCRWYGRRLVVISRWIPTSKQCSCCGSIAAVLSLNQRSWVCHGCNTIHDRDINAAINIKAAGLAVPACGADVRPQRKNLLPSGQSAMNQECQRATAELLSGNR